MTIAVLGGSAFVFSRMTSGYSFDGSGLNQQVINLQRKDKLQISSPHKNEQNPAESVKNRNAADPGMETLEPVRNTERRISFVFGGVAAIEDNVRKSGYSTDSKKYDFSDIMTPLVPELDGDLTGVFLENLLLDDSKVSSTVVPSAGADMLKAAGVNCVFAGFSRAWDKREAGIKKTVDHLHSRGINSVGLLEKEDEQRYLLTEIHGIRVALMQYTDAVPLRTRKSMEKEGLSWMIPEADVDQISLDISEARGKGAQIVIVLINWGKTGARNPEKRQMILAQQIADLGADALIGAGSRISQRAEWLVSATGRKMLCAYSLGTLISDSRNAPNRMGGYLLKLSFLQQANGTIGLDRASYVPTYVWRYKQDGNYAYRILAADRPSPDGMDSEQVRQMQKTMNAVQEVLEGGPLTLR